MSALLTMNMLEKSSFNWNTLANPSEKWPKLFSPPRSGDSFKHRRSGTGIGRQRTDGKSILPQSGNARFPDFKLHLAQSLANGTPYVNRNVDEDDSVDAYTAKIFESAMATLDHVRQSLDMSSVNRAVDLLTQAKRIAFFGLGSSAAVAHDAMNKFFRFNVPVIYSDDIVLQRMSCMNCSEDDVVVLISHTGRTKSQVELAQLARENDAMVIALTTAGTPLAREATLAITLDVPEDTDMYMPMVSRLAQLTVIDVLATGFTLRRGTKFRDNLKRVKEALKESRFDKESLIKSDVP